MAVERFRGVTSEEVRAWMMELPFAKELPKSAIITGVTMQKSESDNAYRPCTIWFAMGDSAMYQSHFMELPDSDRDAIFRALREKYDIHDTSVQSFSLSLRAGCIANFTLLARVTEKYPVEEDTQDAK